MNKLLNGMYGTSTLTTTENGAVTRNTTYSDLYDMFAFGGAYRNRSEADVIELFAKAFAQSPSYAIRCLFYLRDVRGGQGERRFFRTVLHYLGDREPMMARYIMQFIPEFGRWDDFYAFVGTHVEMDAFMLLEKQFKLDLNSNTPSLLAKWLKSENTNASSETARLGSLTRRYFRMSPRAYRKALSALREKIRIVERLMSQGRWNEIQFDKLPSKAGLRYKNAFARNDYTRARYEAFANSKTTKVNAGTLYPYEVVERALKCNYNSDNTDRQMVNKYWDNLPDYLKGATLNALVVADTSGSMRGTPINVAISLALYCAERANGPFKNHYISFASRPQLIRCDGFDFVDKVDRIYRTNLIDNTNVEAVFDLLLNTAIRTKCNQSDLPESLIIVSDMEFDSARGYYGYTQDTRTLMENIKHNWECHGYEMPKLIFWNVDARQNNAPMMSDDGITYVSGFSPSIFQSILTGKTAMDLMFETLNGKRYAEIKI